MILADKNSCTACMACVDICPTGILEIGIDKNGYYKIFKNKEKKCIECGRCFKVCPILNDLKNNNNNYKSKFFAAWNEDDDYRINSASGGVFSALAVTVLDSGGVVYGAAIEGFTVVHKRITDKKNLNLILGTKYQQSNLKNIYKLVRKDLINGKIVLFSGMSCQIAGLFSFLSGKYLNNLYTVDTVCGGVSTLLPMCKLKESGQFVEIKSFRDKDNGWRSSGFKYNLKMIDNNGEIINLKDNNIVIKSFSSWLLKRSSCLKCKFKSINRISDCTIGDLWGDKEYVEEHEKGLSLLIIHTKRIYDLILKAKIELRKTDSSLAVKYNPNVFFSTYNLISYLPSRYLILYFLRNNKKTITYKLLTNTNYLIDYKLVLVIIYKRIKKMMLNLELEV